MPRGQLKYWRFKEFGLWHGGQAGLAVCTENCWFGAIAALPTEGRVLDAGTGSGLLALMAAQREATISIEGWDSNAEAIGIARLNFAENPFAKRLSAHVRSVESIVEVGGYDAIICNPPFFTSGPKSAVEAVAMALHTDEDLPKTWMRVFARLLNPGGTLSILIPPSQTFVWIDAAMSYGIHLKYQASLQHSSGKPVLRYALLFEHGYVGPISIASFIVGDTAYQALLRDFYLKL